MKRLLGSGTTVALLLTLASSAAAQQPPPDGWAVTVAPYLMGAGIAGTVGARGLEAEIDVSASEILDRLEFGAMGIVTARKGNWGFGADLIWVGLGATADVPPAEVDFDQSAFAFYGLRRLNAAAEVTFGLRVNGLDGRVTSTGPLGATASQSKWWVDPLVGIRLRSNSPGRINVVFYGEVGGFGAGSDFAWQAFPVLDMRMTERMSLDVGYRWLGTDYRAGDGSDAFVWDTVMQGPVLGFVFRF
jgi:opacity protein-like surface antigen